MNNTLNLKTHTGALSQLYFDLPGGTNNTADTVYFRCSERWLFPPSYRTGLTFFVILMIIGLMTITAFHAKTTAFARSELLNAHILTVFSDLSQEQPLKRFQDQVKVENRDPLPSVLKSPSPALSSELLDISLNLNKGYKAFQEFQNAWKPFTDQNHPLSFTAIYKASQKVLKHWTSALSRSERFPLLSLPLAAQERVNLAITEVGELHAFVDAFSSFFDLFKALLGASEPQRILILIQDPTRPMPTGGALSVGVELLIDQGQILSQKPFSLEKIDLSSARGGAPLATSNSFFDVQQSAQHFHKIWQRKVRSSVDWIIWVSNSAISSISLEVFSDAEKLIRMWPSLRELAFKKEIFITSFDPEFQARLSEAGISGVLPSSPREDFLMVNIRDEGASSTLHTVITLNGTIKHWLKLKGDQPISVVVPKGSLLSSVDGLSILDVRTQTTEGQTIWSFERANVSRKKSEIALVYELPWTFDTSSVDNYRLRLLKQPGSPPLAFEHHFKLPAGLTLFHQLPEDDVVSLDRDRVISLVAGRNP